MFSFLYPFIRRRPKKPTDCWKNVNLLFCSNTRVGLFYYCLLWVSLHHEGNFKTSQNTKRIQQQLQKNYVVVHQRQPNNRFKLLVPTLIIITFLLFTIGPNIIRIFVVRGDISNIGYRIAFMFVSIGFIADAFIYIFNLNVVRKGITNIIWRHNSVHPTNC